MRKKPIGIAFFLLLVLFINYATAIDKSDTEIAIDDTTITNKVKKKILADDKLSALKIYVKTEDGIVKLSGEVNSFGGLHDAIEIAYSTEGVLDVEASGLNIALK